MNRKFLPLAFILAAAIFMNGCGLLKKPAPSTEKPVSVETQKEAESATVEATTEEAGKPGVPAKPTEEALPPPSVTQMELILDASGSMWGQVEGKAKIDVAKEAMNQIIDDLKAKENLEVALRIYAHQNKECTNSVVEIPMGKINADAMKGKIKDIKPLGMTPIYYSLTESVKDFNKDLTGDRVVVLVTDGLESCNGDPCAAAKALKAGGVVSKIHVVGFGLTKTELETLKCIAEPSGGLVVGASNATEFLTAMQEILKKTLEFNLVLNGKTKKDESVFMRVKVMRDGKEVAQAQGGHVQLMLPAGTYDIEAESVEGLGTVEVKGVSVKEDEETKKDILFAKTTILVNVIGADGKTLQAKDMCVFPAGETEKEVKCAGIYTDKFEFKLQPGNYDVHAVNAATQEDAWVKGIELKEGDEVQKTISFAQGSLKVNVVGADGGPLQSKDMCVFPAGEAEKEVKCAGIYTDKFEFKLVPGMYDVHLKNAATSEEAWAKGVEVKASETVSRTISFAQGSIKVNVVGADGGPLQAKDMCVFPAGEAEKEVRCAGIYTDKFEFKLVPGVYDLHLRNAATSEEKWIKGIEVKASETATQTVSFAQGSIKVNVVGADGKPLQSKDMCVYKTGETENEVGCSGIFTDRHEFKLTPGTYDLHLASGGTSEEKWIKGIEVKASETVTQTVTFEQGILVFNVTNAQGEKAAPEYEMCVYNAGEMENEVGCAGIYTNTHKFTLRPGNYDLFAKNYKTKEEKWEKGVKVEAAKETIQNIVF